MYACCVDCILALQYWSFDVLIAYWLYSIYKDAGFVNHAFRPSICCFSDYSVYAFVNISQLFGVFIICELHFMHMSIAHVSFSKGLSYQWYIFPCYEHVFVVFICMLPSGICICFSVQFVFQYMHNVLVALFFFMHIMKSAAPCCALYTGLSSCDLYLLYLCE